MKKLLNFISIMALLVLTACSGATVINTDKEAVDFTIEGGENTVSVSADGRWNVETCPEWATTEIQDSTLVIKTARNETGAVREGYIVLKGKDNVQTVIKVTQAAKCTHITPETDMVEFEKEGGTQTVKIDTDGSPKVEAPEGFTAAYAGGVLTINAPANEAGGKNGEIKLTGDDQSATIAVTQKGNVCPKCNGTGKIKCSKCGGKGYTSRKLVGDEPGWDIRYYGCKQCGGYGFKTGQGLISSSGYLYDGEYIRKGSGHQTCPACGGSGR